MKSFLKKVIIGILSIEARLVLKKYKPRIVAVTGSVGKTSTKDAIFAVLSDSFYVRKSEKSFNSELGVPLTVLGLPSGWNNMLVWTKNIWRGLSLILLPNHYPNWLVLEIGADRPGDIKKITRWIRPDIVVVTRMSKVPAHVEYFDTARDVVHEKGYLVRALKRDGIVILNADDEDVAEMRKLTGARALFYGFSKDAQILASHEDTAYETATNLPLGLRFKVEHDGKVVPVSVKGVLGRHHVYPPLAAIALGVSQNLNVIKVTQALGSYAPPLGRMNTITGKNGSVIIDDTYNSSPIALEEALKTLASLNVSGRKIAVLGDMLELGRYSIDEHKRMGTIAKESANILITVGIRARYIAEEALRKRMAKTKVHQFDETEEAGEKLLSLLKAGDTVLIKGSQGMRMERIVEVVMAHPERRHELLVRQEPEWLKR